jgi:hypothetical protein
MWQERITRKQVVEEIQKQRIRDALARPIDGDEITKAWKDMKARPKTKTKTQRSGRTEEVTERMLEELRGLDVERTNLDEMVALSTFGRAMEDEYKRLTIPVPEWLEDRLSALDREIRLRRTDALQAKLKELEARKEALKTADQKRQDVDAEMAKVKAALGINA